jgi:hypothetical protein
MVWRIGWPVEPVGQTLRALNVLADPTRRGDLSTGTVHDPVVRALQALGDDVGRATRGRRFWVCLRFAEFRVIFLILKFT